MGSQPIAKKFGALIRHLRTRAGWSQEEFADRCGLHRTYIGAIERGEKTVTIETANRLAKALSLNLSQIFADLEK
jgi:transcriptional regulator with XRE-family HTH domain